MKITTIRVKEDLKMRLNRLKYQYGYTTLDQVIRHLLELKTPALNSAKSHQKSGNSDSFLLSNPEQSCPNDNKEKKK